MTKVTTIDGLPVVDAKRPLTIEVVPRDISRADNKDPANCAFSRACRRQYHHAEVRVHLSCTYVRQRGGHQWLRYKTTPAMQREIVVFDRGGEFAPGTYKLGAVPPSNRAGARKERAQTPRGTHGTPKSRRPRARHLTANVRGGAGRHEFDGD